MQAGKYAGKQDMLLSDRDDSTELFSCILM